MKTLKHYVNSMRYRMIACFAVSLFFLTAVTSYYFYAFRASMNRQVNRSFEQISLEIEHQITERLSLVDQMVKTVGYSSAMQNYLFSSVAANRILNKTQAERDVSMWADMYPYVKGLYYLNPSYHIYSNYQYASLFERQIACLEQNQTFEFSEAFYSGIRSLPDGSPCFFYCIPIRNILYSSASTGFKTAAGIVLCDLSALTGLSHIPENSLCAVLYEDNIVSANRELSLTDENLIWQAKIGKTSFDAGRQRYLSYLSSIPSTSWRMVFIIPEHSVLDGLFLSQNYMFGLIIFGSLLVLFLLLGVSQSVNRSIGQMLKDINRLTGGRDGVRLREPKTTELKVLSLKINEMLERIDRSIEVEEASRQKLFDAVVARQDAEMAAYRSQINPHFLFNTLECMRSMANFYQAEPIEELVTSMADLFHYSLYSSDVVTFEQELNHLRSYLEVMSVRYPGQYEFRTDIAPDTHFHPVPSMLLQPLAENVIKHAFTGMHKPCRKILLLTARHDESGSLFIRLIDNGRGMTKEELDLLDTRKRLPDEKVKPKKDSIGIQNIFKRLKLYSVHCHINYYAKPGCYTIVELKIPASR